MKRKVLGRGIEALIPSTGSASAVAPQGSLREIDIDLLSPNRYQPRTDLNAEKLVELAASIKQNGMVQPVVVRQLGTRYELVAGERRWRAAQLAGLVRIPAIVKNVDEEKSLEIALIENIQREELNAIEEAQAYQRLWEHFGLSQEEISQRVGKSRATVANALRLLKLAEKVRKLLIETKLTMGHARALLPLEDPKVQMDVAQQVMERELSVRNTEKLVRHILRGEKKSQERRIHIDPNVKAAEEKLRIRFGTKVMIRRSGKGGKLEIYYFNNDELGRIYGLLMGRNE
ncbi:MAG: ParB/RepB/Spo0J family partition protein [Acidobacteria bacterium]|nr:ParB/RepB/Spo0J family partition protein [Acidobacteriota bacterium]